MNMHTPKGPNGKPPTPRRTSSAESKECQVCKKVLLKYEYITRIVSFILLVFQILNYNNRFLKLDQV